MVDHLLLRAARGEVVERPPVWAMRQAGRWDPEFQTIRAGLSFYDFSENVERAALASLAPRRFGVDAIILFYDITTLPVAMGLPFELKPQQGPVPDRPIRTQADLNRLSSSPDPESYQHITALLKRVKNELNGSLPVLAFAGAPFTVAAYCIGTGKHMDQTRRFAAENQDVWRGLLNKLSEATIGFLRTMVSEGAAMYQLFDSWAGELTLPEYDDWAHPYHKEIIAGVAHGPSVIFVKECPYLDRLTETGAEVISLGSRHDLAAARRQYPQLVFQGNLDQEVLAQASPEEVRIATQLCLQAGGGQRHIVNLNHGCDKSTPVENFQVFVDTVRSYQQKAHPAETPLAGRASDG